MKPLVLDLVTKKESVCRRPRLDSGYWSISESEQSESSTEASVIQCFAEKDNLSRIGQDLEPYIKRIAHETASGEGNSKDEDETKPDGKIEVKDGNNSEDDKAADDKNDDISISIDDDYECNKHSQINIDHVDVIIVSVSDGIGNGKLLQDEKTKGNEEKCEEVSDSEGQTTFITKMGENGEVTIENKQQHFIINKANNIVTVIGDNNTVNITSQNCALQYLPSALNEALNDYGDHVKIIINPSLSPASLQRTGSLATNKYNILMKCMKTIQDNGLRDKLEGVVSQMNNNFNIDLKVAGYLERALFHIYSNELDVADHIIQDALDMSRKAENCNLLTGRCYIFLAHLCLYKKDYNMTISCLEKASYFLAHYVSGEDKAFLCYLYGYVNMKMAGESNKPRPDLEAKSLQFFQLDIQHSVQDPDPRVRTKRLHYAMFKQVTILLRSYSNASRLFPVNQTEITEAKNLLDSFEYSLWDSAPPGTRVHFFALRSDLFYRMNGYKRAIEILEGDGLRLASDVGHAPLLSMVNDRLEFLKPLVEKEDASLSKQVDFDEEISNIFKEKG